MEDEAVDEAGGTLYLRAVAHALPPRPRRVRPIVILGAGGIVQAAHLPAYAKAGFPVIALADRESGKASQVAQSYASGDRSVRGFDRVADAVRYAPEDAVFDLAVPASQLVEVLELLPDGAAALLQKPMGETLAEASAIREVCRRKKLTAAVNFQLRYAPNHLGAQALARAGLLGELHDMEVQVRTYTPWELWTFLRSAPRLEILYHSIHYLDLVRAWFGNPLSVYAKTVRNPQTAALSATKTSMVLDYGEWKRVVIATNHGFDFAAATERSGGAPESFVQWEGTSGVIRMGMGVNLDYPRGLPDTLAYARRKEPGTWRDVPVRGNWFPDAFMGSMGALQAYVEGSLAELPIHVESAWETMALVEAAYRSSAGAGEALTL